MLSSQSTLDLHFALEEFSDTILLLHLKKLKFRKFKCFTQCQSKEPQTAGAKCRALLMICTNIASSLG